MGRGGEGGEGVWPKKTDDNNKAGVGKENSFNGVYLTPKVGFWLAK